MLHWPPSIAPTHIPATYFRECTTYSSNTPPRISVHRTPLFGAAACPRAGAADGLLRAPPTTGPTAHAQRQPGPACHASAHTTPALSWRVCAPLHFDYPLSSTPRLHAAENSTRVAPPLPSAPACDVSLSAAFRYHLSARRFLCLAITPSSLLPWPPPTAPTAPTDRPSAAPPLYARTSSVSAPIVPLRVDDPHRGQADYAP